MAACPPRPGPRGRTATDPALTGREDRQASRSRLLLPVHDREGSAHSARHRPAGRQGPRRDQREASVKRNRFVALTGGTRTLDTQLEQKARTLAGWKAYVTTLTEASPEFVIGAYHQLWRIEQSFRMSKSDLRARPIYARKRNSIEAHLTIVFAALAIARHVENATGWSIKRFVQTARRYRTVTLRIGDHPVPADEDLPTDLRTTLAQIT